MTLEKIKENQTIQKLFLCFWMYAVLGWIYEVFLEVVVYRWGFTNRGVLFGPYCPVYGVGAMAFLLCFSKIMEHRKEGNAAVKFILRPLLIFVGCMAVATLIELVTSYILEFFTGTWPWTTYADYKYNFQARIALSTSLRFGLGGTLFLYGVQPFYDWILSKPSKKAINTITAIVIVIVIIDCIYTFLIK